MPCAGDWPRPAGGCICRRGSWPLLPLGLLIYLRWSSPTAARAYQTTLGQEVLAGAALLVVVGYLLTLWLARLDEDERVLVRPG